MDNQLIKTIRTSITLLAVLGVGYSLGYKAGLGKMGLPYDVDSPDSVNATQKQEANNPNVATSQLFDTANETSQQLIQSSSQQSSQQPTTSSPTLSTLFEQLLTMGKYAEAINLYHTAWNISQEESDKLRQRFISHIQQLVVPYKAANSAQINNALEAYLADFYDDISVLLLKSFHEKQQGFFYEMLNTLQLAKTYAYRPEQQQLLNTSYRQLVEQTDQYFVDQNDPYTLIDLYLHAETLDLLTDENQFRLIALYIQTNNVSEAQPYIDQLNEIAAWQEKIAAILPATATNNNDENDTTSNSIALTKVGHQFVINASLSNIDTPLLIDTGASLTTITKSYYESIRRQANFRFISQQTFSTANGQTSGTIYQADELTLGEYKLNNVDIAVLDYPSSEYSVGLLGMNVLRHFDFEIDQQNSQLILKAIEESTAR